MFQIHFPDGIKKLTNVHEMMENKFLNYQAVSTGSATEPS